ncbi:MAG TPA: nitrile hydratase accessory protein [Candidatus Binataceae bacterium]|nr:nitrile hydratase accessory protein [Candidatus Binataceae bacterium]
MNQLDELIEAARLDPDRVFSAPWEARAFAIAVKLADTGVFTWDEFREYLIEEVGKSDKARKHDAPGQEQYYEHFLRALEHLLESKGISLADH